MHQRGACVARGWAGEFLRVDRLPGGSRMTDEEKKANHFDPESYPALMEFLPAYLHEDFGVEYGSAARAFAAFVSDANGYQIRNVKEEWQALRQAFFRPTFHYTLSGLGQL